jgi:hypothetical protein
MTPQPGGQQPGRPEGMDKKQGAKRKELAEVLRRLNKWSSGGGGR